MNLKTLFAHSLRPWFGSDRMKKRDRRRALAAVELLEARTLLTPGANLAFYEFANHTATNTDLSSSDTHAQTTASDISSLLSLGWTGNGEPPNGLALGGAFNETTEPTPAGGQPDYFEFTITPDAGYAMDVATFGLLMRRNDPTSKNSFSVYFDEDPGSGGDNYTTRILTGVVTTEDQFDSFSVNTESMSAFAGITTPLNFRVYAWGTAGTETMRLDNIRVQGTQQTVGESKYAYYGDADRLINPLDELGNRVPDFSSAGYLYGNRPVPDVVGSVDAARIVTVSPVVGDDMGNIQAAIDQVGLMTPGNDGFRGVVQLTAGEFEISNQVRILQSGIVLRGVGDGADPASSTILRGTGTVQRSLVVVGAASGFVSPQSGTIHNITDKYVPVGASSFNVDSTDSWAVGDEVVVQRTSTAEWIADIGMDSIPERSDGVPVTQWSPGGNFDQPYERVITRIEGNRIFLNAPLTNSFEQKYGGGTVFKYTFPRISLVGIENIRGLSDFVSDTDEDHARSFIELQAVEHAWVTNVTGLHFIYATVHATSRSRMVTVDDAVSLDPKSIITGARRYPFVIDGQFTLMKNLYSEEGRHDFVNNSAWRNRGPNVFLNGTAVNSHSSTGPHQRWSTGTLYDTIITDNQIEARNRGNFGSGHGWGGANMVFWNTTADSFIVQNPQTAQNWLIGSTGTLLDETRFGPQPPPNVDAHDTPVDFGRTDNPINSLFVAQLNQRTEFDFEKREYVLGDYDGGEFDGAASADEVFVDAAWLSQVETLAAGQAVSAFDTTAAAQFVAGSFQYDLAPGDMVTAAVLTLGLRGNGEDTTGDSLWLDDAATARSLASLGIADSLPSSATTPLTIELTASDLASLQDGLLNLATGSNTVLDWATLDLAIGDGLVVTPAAAAVTEGRTVTGTVFRAADLSSEVIVSLTSSNPSAATVPATVVIPVGANSATFQITGVSDDVLEATEAVTIDAVSDGFVGTAASINVVDILAHRVSDLTIVVQDQHGNPLPNATIDLSMTQHAFQFGTQVQDRFLTITEAEFDALEIWQRHNLIGDWDRELPTPVWQDAVNYRTAVYDNFNHIIPTNGMQWIQYCSQGPQYLDRAIAEADARDITVTGHAVVWQNDGWPTPNEFRPAANPDAQEFHDALMTERLSANGVLARFSDPGDGPNVLDWDVLNEPIHEKHYSNVFVAGGIYANENEAFADYFIRADALRPDANLAVNDYNILSSGGDAASEQYRDLVNDLLALGAPIDQIKVQAHMSRMVSKADITRRLDILAETGLPIAISEFDMRDDANQISPANQKVLFEDMLEAIFEHPAVTGFSMWGIWDSAHWRGNGPLFDADWNVKDEASPWFDLVQGDWMPDLVDVEVDGAGRWSSPAGLFDGDYRIVATNGQFSTTIDSYELTADGQLFITVDLAAGNVSSDLDGDGTANATTDGILAIRHMFGFTGDALIANAIGAGATNDTAAEVTAVLTASSDMLDVDGDGTINATTDGILFIRYLFGFTGNGLIDNAIGAGAVRTTGSEVQAFLDSYQPSAASNNSISHFAVVENDGSSQTFNWGVPDDAVEFKLTIFDLADDSIVDAVDTAQASYAPSVPLEAGTYRAWLVATNLSGEVVAEFFATFTILVPDE